MELETAASTIEVTDTGIQIRWSDGSRSRFHALWLRDNCQTGGAKQSEDRTFSLTDLNPDVFVLFAERDDNGDLAVEFSDGHESAFDLDWLQENSLELHDRKSAVRNVEHFRAGHSVETFPQPASNSPQHLALLDEVARSGLALITEVELGVDATASLAELFGPLSQTDGGVMIDLVATADDLLSSEGLALDPHTVGSGAHSPPGVSILHCVDATPNAAGVIVVDGFAIATDLQDHDPDAFDLLTQLSVAHEHMMGHRRMRAHAPVISLDRDYEIAGVRFDERALAPLDVDPAQVGAYYRSLIAFVTAVNDPARAIHLSLEPGQALVLDNHRVLRGRTSIGVLGGLRHTRECSVERHWFHGQIRALRESMNNAHADERFPKGSH